MVRKLRELLFDISNQEIKEQSVILQQTIDNWILEGNEKQVDDITVFGLCV